MKIFLTGASGLLGTDLVPILKKVHQVIKSDVNTLDICNAKKVCLTVEKIKPDIIIHGAAYTDVDECEKDKEKAMLVNGLGTKNMAEVAQKLDIPILYVSTDYVFDGKKRNPYRESDPVSPINTYGMSKLMGERYILKNTLKYYIVRTAWLYGRGGKNFVDTILQKAKTEKELKIVNDQVGSPTWSVDLSEVILELIQTSDYGIYHTVNDGECSWYEFAQAILACAGISNVKISPMTTAELHRAAARPAYSKLNTDALENTIGRKLPHWKEALKKYVESKGKK